MMSYELGLLKGTTVEGCGPAIGAAGVRARLPHRYPILLVDRVLELVPGERITTVKAVTCNEPWYASVGPDAAEEQLAYPVVLMLESWGQSAGILAGGSPAVAGSDQVMLFGSLGGVEIQRQVFPGELVEHRARIVRVMDDTVLVAGESLVAGEPVLTVGRAVMAFRPADRLRTHTTAPEQRG